MRLDEIVHRVESRLFGLGRTLIQADPASEMAEELDLVRGQRARLIAELDRAQTHRNELRRSLGDKQAEAALLPSQVESSLCRGKTSQAVRQALELDRLRREMHAGQDELPRLDQACWCIEFRLRQLERRYQQLQEALRRG
jgi:hypothetical protein